MPFATIFPKPVIILQSLGGLVRSYRLFVGRGFPFGKVKTLTTRHASSGEKLYRKHSEVP